MRIWLSCSLLLLLGGSRGMLGQTWEALDQGVGLSCYTIWGDSLMDGIYVGGAMGNLVSGKEVHVAQWNGSRWNWLSAAHADGAPVSEIMRIGDHLYALGAFDSLAGHSVLARWEGSGWSTIPHSSPQYSAGFRAGIQRGDTLIFGGIFDEFDGIASPGVVAYYDSAWHGVAGGIQAPGKVNPPRVYSMLDYQGTIWAAGNSFGSEHPGGGELDLKILQDSAWVRPPGWINGGNTILSSLVEFQGELYVAGSFNQQNGAIGNNIVKWDGHQWHDIGFAPFSPIEDVTVFQGGLYVVGTFLDINGLPVWNIARWDGSRWCSLPNSNFGLNKIWGVTSWRDTLYVCGGFREVNGDTVNYVAKYTGGAATDQCGPIITFPSTSVETGLESHIQISPNPASDLLTVAVPSAFLPATWQLWDVSGRLVRTVFLFQPETTISVADLPPGLYALSLFNKIGKRYGRKVVLE